MENQPTTELPQQSTETLSKAPQPEEWQPQSASVSPEQQQYAPVVPSVPVTYDVAPQAPQLGGLAPQPVVQVLSPRGVEYVFLTIALFTGAIGLIAVLITLFNGKLGFNELSFPVSLLVVAVPVFAWLFLRLKKAELNDPSLALDPSKRRSTQTVQIAAFVACFFTPIGFIASIFAKVSGAFGQPIWKSALDALAILIVAGGILAYYWRDEHKA